MQTLVRKPAVAGLFYERDPDALRAQLEWCFTHRLGPGRLPEEAGGVEPSIGFIVPHAALNYSGPVAAHAYARMRLEGRPETIIVIGPNHTGLGAKVAVSPPSRWETPLGVLEVDGELAEKIVRESSYAELDMKAHLFEHSIEVQLPFIAYLYGTDVRIVPVVLWDQDARIAEDLGSALASALEATGRRAVVIATTNLTHYQPLSVAREHDKKIIDCVMSLDYRCIYDVVEKMGSTMCGPGAVATLIVYSRRKGGRRAELLAYATSGDITGDTSSVVGYASMRVY